MLLGYFGVKRCWNKENAEKGARNAFLKFAEKVRMCTRD